jgi:2Fe-2S ferredoxin
LDGYRRTTSHSDTPSVVIVGAGQAGFQAAVSLRAMCATCHVYVEPARGEDLPPKSSEEEALLDGVAAERKPNSRLSCQLTVVASMEGLIVRIPAAQ